MISGVLVSAPARPKKKRVFTEDEYKFLESLPAADLLRRIRQGHHLIGLLEHPAMLNMTPREAARVSSNLRFQIDEITAIIRVRPEETING